MCEQNINHNQEDELRLKATEHDMSDAQQADISEAAKLAEEAAVSVYQKIEDGVVGGYRKIEDTVVGGYKKIEDGVVECFGKMTDKLVELLFIREGESVDEAKERLSRAGDASRGGSVRDK